jgi:hypothetical protein
LGHEAVNLTPTFVLVPESWNDRRADLPDAASDKKTDSKHDNILKDSADHGAGDLSVKGGKSETDIAAPQEDLYAHELQHHDTDSEHDHHLLDHHEEHHEHEEDHHQLSIRDDPEPHEDLVPKILTNHIHTKLDPLIIAQREHDRNHLHSLSDTDKHFKIREDFLKNHLKRSDAEETDLTPRREGESKEAMRYEHYVTYILLRSQVNARITVLIF